MTAKKIKKEEGKIKVKKINKKYSKIKLFKIFFVLKR